MIIAYQLGNLASSASSTIEAQIGTRFPLNNDPSSDAYDYGKVVGIFCGAVYTFMILVIFCGPERFHRVLNVNDEDEECSETASDVMDYQLKQGVVVKYSIKLS